MSFRDFDDVGFDIANRQRNKTYRDLVSSMLDKDETNDPCPPGWRIPCNNEFLLITALKPNVSRESNKQTWQYYDWWTTADFHNHYASQSYVPLRFGTEQECVDYILGTGPNRNNIIETITTKTDGMAANGVPGGITPTQFTIWQNNNLHYGKFFRVLPVRDVE